MDFGQSSPEDEDLYSTRSWATLIRGRAFPHCHLDPTEKKKNPRKLESV